MMNPALVFIVGPTAVGKTAAACDLAEAVSGEIVSCDAMQVYREVRIASNKPSPEDLARVPHHLIDVVSVDETFDVASYHRLASAAVKDVLDRRKIPVICGGSGMYMQVLLDGIFSGGEAAPRVRQALMARVAAGEGAGLYAELRAVDPQAAARVHPHDVRRVIRALEVYQTTSRPISQLREERRGGLWGRYPVYIYGLDLERSVLYARINARVEAMIREGLLEEIRALSGRPLSETARRIIGLRELQDYFEGVCSLDEAVARMQMNTRRYAKRQMTWFRKEARLTWISVNPGGEAPGAVAARILADIKARDER